MRAPVLLLAALLAALPAAASAAPRRARSAQGDFDLAFGLDLGVQLREEGGGNRTAMPSLGLRASADLDERFGLSLGYGFAWRSEGSLLQSFTQYHRLQLRPEFMLSFGTAALVVAAGPGLLHGRTSFTSGGEELASSWTRLGASGGLALEADLDPVTVRLGADAMWAAYRLDFFFGAGVVFALGGGR